MELVVAHCMSYAEVGRELGVSVHTVRSHVEDIYRRLGCDGGSPRKAMARHFRDVHARRAA